MLFLTVVFHFAFLCFVNQTHGLESLPRAIAPTEAVRHVVNKLFSNLKIKVDKNSKVKEYSKIYKYYARLTRLENNDWKELLKVTSTDIKIDNGTADFTSAINEVLSEENKTENLSDTLNEETVNKHIEDFLGTLEKLKELYLRNNTYIAVNNEVLQQFHKSHGNSTENNELKPRGNDENEVWNPSNTRRIYQGERTKIKTFPFVASVQLFNEFTCAGSVIERDLVITAASCLQLAHNNRFYRENPTFLSVRVGSSFYNGAGEVIPVMEVYFHPSYDPKTLHNNLAIMRLHRKINLKRKRNVKKIILDTNAWTLAPNTDGITIVGWGAKTKTNKIHNAWENKISQAVLDFYPLLDCQDIYSREFVTKKNFCAGFISHGGGACNRDIGAPGVVHGTLTGVVSFGSATCGSADAPTVFTKLGYYTDWIEEIMEQKPAQFSVKPTTRLPIFYHTVMSTRPMRELNFLIEPMDSVKIKSLQELDVRTRNSKEKFNEFLNFKFDHNDTGGNGEGASLRELNKDGSKKRKKSKRKTNKVQKEAGNDGESSAETSYEPLQSFVTKLENFDVIGKSSGETDKSANKNDEENLPETNKVKITETRLRTVQPPGSDESEEKEKPISTRQKEDTSNNADMNEKLLGSDESKEKEKAILTRQKEDASNNADMDEKSLSDTDKEFAALALQEPDKNVTPEVVTTPTEPTTTAKSEQPGSKEIAQAIEILSKVVNRPKGNTGGPLQQELAKPLVNQELEMEEQIDDLFEEKMAQNRQEEIIIDSKEENEHKNKVIEDTKLLEMLEQQARQEEKEPKPPDDNILTLLYFSDSERDSKLLNRAPDTYQYSKRSEGINIIQENVKNLTDHSKVADQVVAVMSKGDVYDILAEAMGAE